MDNETRRASPLTKYGKVITYTAMALIFLIPAGLTITYGVCTLNLFPEVCRYDHLYLMIVIMITVTVLLPIGRAYHTRAIRSATRGMYHKPGQLEQAFNHTLQLVTSLTTEQSSPEPGLITGLDRFSNYGWWVRIPASGGTTVWIDQYQFWQWLEKVEAMRLTGDKYPTARDRWESVIGKSTWLAYCTILETVGVLQFTTEDPRSKRYQGAVPWSVVEQYAKMYPPVNRG